jgi:hypothetical protein
MSQYTTDALKLANFLDNNQLVQAHAIATKISGRIEDEMKKLKAKPSNGITVEGDPRWNAYRAAHRIDQLILQGKTTDARREFDVMWGHINTK